MAVETHRTLRLDGWTFVEVGPGSWQSHNPAGEKIGRPGGIRHNVWLALDRYPTQDELLSVPPAPKREATE